jgi:superfamily II RNA helicase
LVLLETASELVLAKLIAENQHSRPEIHHAVAMATNGFRDTAHSSSSNHADTQVMIRSLKDSEQLGDDTIRKFSED